MDIVHLLAIVASLSIVLFVIELIRRGRLKEKYSLLWLFSSLSMLGLSLSRGVLEGLSELIGVYYAPSLLFLMAFLFLLLINLHFSIVLSELSEKNKRLAQQIALLQFEIDKEKAKMKHGERY